MSARGSDISPSGAWIWGVRIERGERSDLRAMERMHYARGAPAPPVLVMRAVHRTMGVVGVLSVSMPVLNGPWREDAWPGLVSGVRAPERARLLNREVRTISRVIVDRRVRASGIGVALVRAYLAAPLTVCTEAIASMGRHVPLFERAGMRAVGVTRAARDFRLVDALEHAGLTAMDLADEASAGRAMRSPFVRVEVDRWLNGARGTRGLLDASRAVRARAAARVLIAPAMVYVCGNSSTAAEQQSSTCCRDVSGGREGCVMAEGNGVERNELKRNGRGGCGRGAREVPLTFWVTPLERRLITRVLARACGRASGSRVSRGRAGALMVMLGLGERRSVGGEERRPP